MGGNSQRRRARTRTRIAAAVALVIVATVLAPALGAVLAVGLLTVGGIRARAAHERSRQIAPDLRRADDTSPGGDVRDVGFADKIFLGGDGV